MHKQHIVGHVRKEDGNGKESTKNRCLYPLSTTHEHKEQTKCMITFADRHRKNRAEKTKHEKKAVSSIYII